MKMKHLLLMAGIALATGAGMSVSNSAQAGTLCQRICSQEYTQCWYSCPPGDGTCFDLCRINYYGCVADCG